MSQVQRSACSGVQTDGVVHPKVPFWNRKPCSMAKHLRYARAQRSESGSPSPDHHSHSVLFTPPLDSFRCSTSTRMTLPRTIKGMLWRAQWPRAESLGCSPCQALMRTEP
jgi:hypothetical protein